MNHSLAFWNFVAGYLRNGDTVACMVVAESSGSSPGRRGFMMAVGSDGRLSGSIGGGIMEVKWAEMAKDMLLRKDYTTIVKEQIHQKSAPRHRSGMICSGKQTVILFFLSPQRLRTIRNICRALRLFESFNLYLSNSVSGIRFEIRAANEASCGFKSDKTPYFSLEWQAGFRDRIYIAGAGHCGHALARLMYDLGFYVCLLDDRHDLPAMKSKLFVHDHILLSDYSHIGQYLPSGPAVYIVVMTLGYRTDEIVIRQLWHKEYCYLGLLGSRAKIEVLKENLLQDGYDLSAKPQLHAPAGIPIHSQTPEEIAVSISAEIIGVRGAKKQQGTKSKNF